MALLNCGEVTRDASGPPAPLPEYEKPWITRPADYQENHKDFMIVYCNGKQSMAFSQSSYSPEATQ